VPLKCPKCGHAINDKIVLGRCAQIANEALMAKKGPDYFKELQAKRKTRAGGRPRTKSKA